ncbi:hypothetical protein GHK86_01810 [Acidimicrobiaceae bacterium USS-CC1]|uniref:Uncharacterized protein n=1 Tax=Acidiferrimicrobium australe TaxID=2664430 RepID=A0ABW9QNU7_9ACTN|nr:hypothetical protein [Acidiferrimicrobium australe]
MSTSVVPPVITVAYVDAVFAKLDAVYGNALRSMAASRLVTQGAIGDVYAIFTQRLAPTAIQALGSLKASNFRNLRADPGDQHTHVDKLLFASNRCIFARVTVDYSGVDVHAPPPPFAQYEALTSREPINVREGDPTAWAIFYDNVLLKRQDVRDPCG